MRILRLIVLLVMPGAWAFFGVLAPASAASTSVAVASSFSDAATEIAAAFTRATGHRALLSFGATGQLYTQITQEAPFEVLLAADDKRPARAVQESYGVAGSVFTYAIGRLVLYSADRNLVTGPEVLESSNFRQIAIANPETAPYGLAAVQVMSALGVYETLRPRIVQGQNIGQTWQFVQTGNAGLGFVASGQVSQTDAGSRWLVPQELHEPIRQDAVLLRKGRENPAAIAFLEFLQGEIAAEIIKKYAYVLIR